MASGIDPSIAWVTEGPTFSLKRIQRQLKHDFFSADSELYDGNPISSDPLPYIGGKPSPFICEQFGYKFELGRHIYYSLADQERRRELFCFQLFENSYSHGNYCRRLDQTFSGIITCNFEPLTEYDKISVQAYQILTRLPARPIQIPGIPDLIDPGYIALRHHETKEHTAASSVWRSLQVTSYVSTNVIRTAILATIYGGKAAHMLTNFIDTIADLMTTATKSCSMATSTEDRQKWFIVRTFLWTSWQRCTMIYFYVVLGSHLQIGFDDQDGHSLILRGMVPSPDLSIQTFSKRWASADKPRYMCGWAFELLRSDPVCIGLDFRRLFFRYSQAFGEREARCINGQKHASCAGDESDKCQRFKGMQIENQSHHDGTEACHCKRLTWDEGSYRRISDTGAAVAVALENDSASQRLSYRPASPNTLAISHVWSHGQGGRPEPGHGLNACLHRRYIFIAATLDCDSYWMDTPCIPEDHNLRDHAIRKINEIFEQSKAILACDRDLMTIDASDLTSLAVRELILATALVCDWNLRAWTFLEAFRGRNNIYVLCKDNAVVSLRETVEIVHREGSLDIAILLLTIPHLLPPGRGRDNRTTSSAPFKSGFLTIQTAGSLLSHRAASRPGDDIVIWSLLLYDDVYKNAKDFWRSRKTKTLPTSFLISTAPRLRQNGLRWAPSSPTAQLVRNNINGSMTRIIAFDGLESDHGIITEYGFSARWLMYAFVGSCICAKRLSLSLESEVDTQPSRSHPINIRAIRRRFLKGYAWGALLRPINQKTYDGPAPNREDVNRILLVVCASNGLYSWPWDRDTKIYWTWRGVYEWNVVEPLPRLVATKDVVLV